MDSWPHHQIVVGDKRLATYILRTVKRPSVLLDRRLGGPQGRYGRCGVHKSSWRVLKTNSLRSKGSSHWCSTWYTARHVLPVDDDVSRASRVYSTVLCQPNRSRLLQPWRVWVSCSGPLRSRSPRWRRPLQVRAYALTLWDAENKIEWPPCINKHQGMKGSEGTTPYTLNLSPQWWSVVASSHGS